MTDRLKYILQSDPFNAYCLDCKENLADHASLTFGLFICGGCANKHKVELGLERSYIKSVFNENWDEYQLKIMELGGNKAFFEFIKYYGIEDEDNIKKKYMHRGAVWWSLKLRAKADNHEFKEKAPSKTDFLSVTKEMYEAGKEKTMNFFQANKNNIKSMAHEVGDTVSGTFKGIKETTKAINDKLSKLF